MDPAEEEERTRHHVGKVALSRALYVLIGMLVDRGKRGDPAWQGLWRKAVQNHGERFQMWVELKAPHRTLEDVNPRREQWSRMFNLDPSEKKNVSKYLLNPNEDTDGGVRASFDGLSFNQIEEVSRVLVEDFNYAPRESLPSLRDEGTWSRVVDHAIARLRVELSEPGVRITDLAQTASCFIGRDVALAKIDAALKRDDDRVAIVALHGLRGVGKTIVAATYAHEHRGEYRATWWVRAQAEESIRADLISLGRRLRWVQMDQRDDDAIRVVIDNLSNTADDILLIFDNATELKTILPFLPKAGRCRALVTSNWDAWRKDAIQIEIDVWEAETGAEFLVARTKGPHNRTEAESLSSELGGLPLALEQAAAYCEERGVGFAQYQRNFESKKISFLGDTEHAPKEYYDGRTVAATFELAIEGAIELHPAAELLIAHAALLAPDPIPLFLFTDVEEVFSEPLNSAVAAGEVDQIVASLRAFALVSRERIADESEPSVMTDSIRLHPLVREVAAARLSGAHLDKSRRSLFVALFRTFPIDGDHNPKSWPRCNSLRPHLLVLWASAPETFGNAEEWAAILDTAGSYYRGRGAYETAEILFRYAVTLMEGAFGKDHPKAAKSYNNLSIVLRDRGQFAQAYELITRVREICEPEWGPDHPELAAVLEAQGNLLRRLGKYAEALPLLERALAISEKVSGANNPAAAKYAISAAGLLRDMNDHVTALKLYQQALAILETAEGSDGAGVAVCLNNIGGLLLMNRGAEPALPLLERSLRIMEQHYGPAHPRLLPHLDNLGGAFFGLRRFSDAREIVKRSLAISEDFYGSRHLQTAQLCTNLSVLLWQLRDPQWVSFSLHGLSVHQEVLGVDHPVTNDRRRDHVRYWTRWYVRKSALPALILTVLAFGSWIIWRFIT